MGKNHEIIMYRVRDLSVNVYLEGDYGGHVGGDCRLRRISVKEDMADPASHFRKIKCKFRSAKMQEVD